MSDRPSIATTGWQVVPPPQKSRVGDSLLLAGAIVGIVLAGLGLLVLPLHYLITKQAVEQATRSAPEFAMVDSVVASMYAVMAGFVLVGLIGGICCLKARQRLRTTFYDQGKGLALTGAILMLVSMNWIAGTLALVGTILGQNEARA